MSLIIGAQSATAAGEVIENSCWFNGTSQGLVRTNPATAVTLGTKSTLSLWAKRTTPNSTGTNQFFQYTNGGSSPYSQMYWKSTGEFQWQNHDTTTNTSLVTRRRFEDPTAWYHLVFSYDSTPATPDSTSVKMFVNGVQETEFDTPVYPAQNVVSQLCKPSVNTPIGYYPSTAWYSGYYAEIICVDGQALNADSFGEFDSDSPNMWKPIDITGIDVGNLGYYLQFQDSVDLGTDTSGIGNFTETALTAVNQATDTPLNNFCTFNPLAGVGGGFRYSTFSLANLKYVTNAGAYGWNCATVGLSAGKWYWEITIVATAGSDYELIGLADKMNVTTSDQLGAQTYSVALNCDNGTIYHNSTSTAYGVTATTGDILGHYLDLDNNKMYWAKNGVIMNSGTGFDISAASATTNGHYFPAVGEYATGSGTYACNFGGATISALTSAQADANGYGNFEYSPNDDGSASFDGSAKDFLAICTKNLSTDGG